MLARRDIDNLALLSRLTLSEQEKDELLVDLGSILDYVSELQQAPVLTEVDEVRQPTHYSLHNVLRADDDVFVGGQNTDIILSQAPTTKNNFFIVKKILDN